MNMKIKDDLRLSCIILLVGALVLSILAGIDQGNWLGLIIFVWMGLALSCSVLWIVLEYKLYGVKNDDQTK
jgi:hypothetical protein